MSCKHGSLWKDHYDKCHICLHEQSLEFMRRLMDEITSIEKRNHPTQESHCTMCRQFCGNNWCPYSKENK